MPDFVKEWWSQIMVAIGAVSWFSTLEWRVRRNEKAQDKAVTEKVCYERQGGCKLLQASNFKHGKERFDLIEGMLREIRDDVKKVIGEK